MSNVDGVEQDTVTWDGKDFATVQMLLVKCRVKGEPACRLPDGDMSRMEVRVGLSNNLDWVPVQIGQFIAVNGAKVVSIW